MPLNKIGLTVLIILALALMAQSYGKQRLKVRNQVLSQEISELKKANQALILAANSINQAAEAQAELCQENLKNRAEISQIINATETVAGSPQGVIDEKSSQKAIEFINTNLCKPFDGLRRAAAD